MENQNAHLAYSEIPIAEHEWLIVALMWMAVGAMALGPFDAVAKTGRILFALIVMVHVIEALYAAFRARTVGLSARIWFLRTIVLGLFACLALDRHIRKASNARRT